MRTLDNQTDKKIANCRDATLEGLHNARFPLPAIERALLTAIALFLALQATLVFFQEINWDEFFFLSQIYDHARGELTRPLQTIHVYLFGRLRLLAIDEIGQITVARLVMLLFELGTMASIYALARLFVSRTAAFLAVLAYITAGFVFLYGASFRTDPIAACLMMVSLVLVARARWSFPVLALVALLLGLAGMVTLKTAFYLPVLVALGLWRVKKAEQPAREFSKLVACGIAALGVFCAFYLIHQSTMPGPTGPPGKAVGSIAHTAFLSGVLFPTSDDLVRGAAMAIVQSLLLVCGLALAVIRFVTERESRGQHAVILMLASPLVSFLFYSNAYPYFFAFIFPPAMIFVGLAYDRLRLSGIGKMALIAIMCLPTILLLVRSIQQDRTAQTEVIEAVHRMFPEPVAYIDRNGMIASFPKRGVFMSAWGLKNYRQIGEPIYGDILRKETVPLLILNSPSLEDAVGRPLSAPVRAELLPEDKIVLASNYIPHWGHIWVAGQSHDLSDRPKTIHIAVPGHYRVEASHPVRLDGRTLQPGEAINLRRRSYGMSSTVPQKINLRWGRKLVRPLTGPSDRPIYRGF